MGPIVLWCATREVHLSFVRVLIHLVPPTLAAIGAGAAARFAIWAWLWLDYPHGIGLLVCATLVGCASYLGLCRLLLRDTFRQILRDLSPTRLFGRSFKGAQGGDVPEAIGDE
jgi:hypothetical protein